MRKHYMIMEIGLLGALVMGCGQKPAVGQNTGTEMVQIASSQPSETIEGLAADSTEQAETAEGNGKVYPSGTDVRSYKGIGDYGEEKELTDQGMTKELIASYSFNELTDFKGLEKVADEIMEEAKNPGIGVRKLHEQGITGKGVHVAIIDQPIEQNHPEYKGKIVEYKSLCDDSEISSMHGPSVMSILAGSTVGVAPDVKVYYVAAPSWTGDAAYQAEALRWIIEKNKTLPNDQKIRVVSVSAAPSGPGSPFDQNNEEWDKAYKEAKEEGILVIDCTMNSNIRPCFLEGEDREDPMCYAAGYGKNDKAEIGEDCEALLAPVASRTMAETYKEGVYSYHYDGTGGLSWGIPYAVGTLALGWQIAPELSNEEIMELLYDSAAVNKEGNRIINPPAFIEAINKENSK